MPSLFSLVENPYVAWALFVVLVVGSLCVILTMKSLPNYDRITGAPVRSHKTMTVVLVGLALLCWAMYSVGDKPCANPSMAPEDFLVFPKIEDIAVAEDRVIWKKVDKADWIAVTITDATGKRSTRVYPGNAVRADKNPNDKEVEVFGSFKRGPTAAYTWKLQ